MKRSRFLVRAAATVTALAISRPVAVADTSATWDGSTNNWSSTNHWSSTPFYPQNGSPAGAQYDVSMGGGNVFLDVSPTIQMLNFSGGAIYGGSQTLTVAGSIAWTGPGSFSGGTLLVSGGLNLSNANGMTITGGANVINPAGQSGTVTVASGGNPIYIAGGVLTNAGALTATGGTTGQEIYGSGNSSSFNNSGSFVANETTGNQTFQIRGITLHNTGTVNVTNGTLDLYQTNDGGATTGSFVIGSAGTLMMDLSSSLNLVNGSSVTGTGTINVGFAATLALNGSNGSYNFAGTTDLNAGYGQMVLGSNATTGTLLLPTGTITGPGQLTVTNPFMWSQGGVLTGGATLLASGGVNISNATGITISSGANLINPAGASGSVLGNTLVYLTNSGMLTNAGTLTASNGGSSQMFYGNGSPGNFNNSGSFIVNETTGNQVFSLNDLLVHNTGTVNVTGGTLELYNTTDGGSTTGAFVIGQSGTLLLDGNTHLTMGPGSTMTGTGLFNVGGATLTLNGGDGQYNFGGTLQLGGTLNLNYNSTAGTLLLGSGTINGQGKTLTVTNPFNWTGSGTLASGTILANGGLNFVNANGMTINGNVINPTGQSGTVTVASGGNPIYIAGGVLTNAGTLTATGGTTGQAFYNNTYNPSSFNNSGSFIVNETTGNQSFQIYGMALHNSGNVNVMAGTLEIKNCSDGGSTTGSFTVASGASLLVDANSYINLALGSSMTGTGTFNLSGATVALNGSNGSFNFAGTTALPTGYSILELGSNSTTGTLSFPAGTITGNGLLSVTNALVLTGGGTLTGGATLLASGGLNILNSPGYNVLSVQSGANLINPAGASGTVMLAASRIDLISGGTLTNAGTLTVSNGSTGEMFYGNGSVGNFNNSGSFIVDETTGNQLFTLNDLLVHNTGTINVTIGTLELTNSTDGGSTTGAFVIGQSGTLLLDGNTHLTMGPGSTMTGTGLFNVGGATLTLNGGDGQYNFPGTLQLGGTLNLNYNSTAGTLLLGSGTINGQGKTLTVTNPFNWTGSGTLASGTILANGGLNFVNANGMTINGNVINPAGQSGTVTVASGGNPIYIAGGVLTNAGALTATGGTTGQEIYGSGSSSSFNNSGSFVANETTGNQTFQIRGITLHNTGTVNVTNGTLDLYQTNDGGATTGSFVIGSAGTLMMDLSSSLNLVNGSSVTGTGTINVGFAATLALNGSNGSYNFAGTTDLNAGYGQMVLGSNATTGTLLLPTGTITGPGQLTVTNPFMWSQGGVLTGGATLLASGGVNISNATGITISSGANLINPAGASGSVLGNTLMYLTNSGMLTNAGTLTASNGGSSQMFYGNGSPGNFNNSGSFIVNETTGNQMFSLNDLLVHNTGTVNVTGGTLELYNTTDGGSTTGAFVIGQSGTLLLDGNTHLTMGPGSTMTGTGLFNVGGATLTLNGGDGQYNFGGTLQLGGTLNLNYNSTAGTLLLGSGTINGQGKTLTVTNPFNWTGSGTLASGTILANGGLNFVNANGMTINGNVINPAGQSGTVTVANGGNPIYIAGGVLTNAGTLTATGGTTGQEIYGSGSSSSFNNSGSFVVNETVGSQSFEIYSLLFHDSGNVNVTAGTFEINACNDGGSTTGSFMVGAGGTLLVDGYSKLTMAAGSSVTGAGAINIRGSVLSMGGSYVTSGSTTLFGDTISLNANMTTGALLLNGTTINGSGGTLTANGPFQCDGGLLARGVTIVANGLTTMGENAGYGIEIDLNADATQPARLVLGSDLVIAGLPSTTSISTGAVSNGQLSGVLDLGGGVRTMTVSSPTSQLLISARLTNGGITLPGPGMTVFSSPGNDFTGGLTVAGGILQVAAAASYSGGIFLTANGPQFGTLQVANDGELGTATNALTIAGGALLVNGTFATSRSIVLGDPRGNGQGTFNVSSSNVLNENGTISGLTGLIKQGAGTITLNGSLSYSGSTEVMAGTLILGPGISLPAQSVINVAPGATFDLGNQPRSMAALQDALMPDESRAGGTVSLGSSQLTVGSLGASTIFSGNINGSTGGSVMMAGSSPSALLVLAGPLTNFTGGVGVMGGTLLLANSANTFTGGVNVSGGALQAISDAAMGASANSISISACGTLEATASISTARTISILNGGGTIAIMSGDTMIESGNITGSAPLTISGTTMIPGSPTGSGTLDVTSAQSISGAITLDGSNSLSAGGSPTLVLNGNGTLRSANSLTLLRQAILEVYDASGLTSGRLNSSTSMNLSGGTLIINGPAKGQANESLGALSVVAGTSSTIDLIDGSGGSVDLTFSTLNVGTGATLILDFSSSFDRIYFTTPPAENSRDFITGVLLSEAGGLTQHVQYSASQGIVPYGTPSAGIVVSGGPTTSVPEPGVCLLGIAGSTGLLKRRRRK